MALEIEHKYLVVNDSYKAIASSADHITQGYLSRNPEATVRVRTINEKGFLTIKSRNKGCVRNEFEYEIPADEARQLLQLCEMPVIEKTRYRVPFEGFTWEVDIFAGDLEGISLAEIEIPTDDTLYKRPPFVGENVTGNPDYYNSNIHRLARKHSLQHT